MKELKKYFKCLFKGHKYFLYYKSKTGEQLWYCKGCLKCQTRIGKLIF